MIMMWLYTVVKAVVAAPPQPKAANDVALKDAPLKSLYPDEPARPDPVSTNYRRHIMDIISTWTDIDLSESVSQILTREHQSSRLQSSGVAWLGCLLPLSS